MTAYVPHNDNCMSIDVEACMLKLHGHVDTVHQVRYGNKGNVLRLKSYGFCCPMGMELKQALCKQNLNSDMGTKSWLAELLHATPQVTGRTV